MYPETGYTSPNELGIIIENNRPVVSSRKVAEVFEKEHNIVMRSIRELGCDDDFSRCNFAQSTYMSDRGKEYPEYL
ncbi:Rha family transcriptional regulator, partial [Cloacibacillus evryensis]